MEGLEARHWPRDPFGETMILLKDIIQILDLQDIDDAPGAGEFQDYVQAL